jgi:hypothetical protein
MKATRGTPINHDVHKEAANPARVDKSCTEASAAWHSTRALDVCPNLGLFGGDLAGQRQSLE